MAQLDRLGAVVPIKCKTCKKQYALYAQTNEQSQLQGLLDPTPAELTLAQKQLCPACIKGVDHADPN